MQFKSYAIGEVPLDEEFARAALMIPDEVFWTCPECGRVHRRGEFQRVIQWPVGRYDAGSDKVGDFTWHGAAYEMLVTDRIRRVLEEKSVSLRFRPVEMWQDPKLKKPKRVTKKTKRRIWLPYTGPKLWDVEILSWCNLDRALSGLQMKSRCTSCDDEMYAFPESHDLVIKRESWDGSPVFRIREFNMIFVTQELLSDLNDMDATNVEVRRTAVFS